MPDKNLEPSGTETRDMVRARLEALLAQANPKDAPAVARLLLEMDAADAATSGGDALDDLAFARDRRKIRSENDRHRQQKRLS